MEPVGIQNIDLVSVGLKRGKACRVPRNVERGANAFGLVQRDLRRGEFRFAVRTSNRFLLAVSRLVSFTLLQSLEISPLRIEEKSGEWLIAQRGIDEENNQGGNQHRGYVECAPQSFPTGASGIIKDWFSHCLTMFIVCRGRHTVNSRRGRVSASLPLYDALSQRRDCRKRAIIRSVRELRGFKAKQGSGGLGFRDSRFKDPDFRKQQAWFFAVASLIAVGFRVWLVFRFPAIVDDSRLYADIAKNWLHHGVYGITNSGVLMPTLSRLPGYPAFLAAIFAIFGVDNFRAVLLVQVLFDLLTCFLIADIARRMFSEGAAKAAFLMAAICPFLANYAATALTETLEIFFTVLALDLVLRGLAADEAGGNSFPAWIGCGLAIGGSILLRPDGGILLATVGGYLFWLLVRNLRSRETARRLMVAGLLVAFCALAPLIPWTLRNAPYLA